jgi:hypothetical protein
MRISRTCRVGVAQQQRSRASNNTVAAWIARRLISRGFRLELSSADIF